jgi:hypothetical protein
VPFTQTITNGTGVTVSGISLVTGLGTGVFLVTYTAASTVTMVGLGTIPLVNLSPSQFVTNAVSGATTAAVGDITGAEICNLLITGVGAAAYTVRTAAQMFADIPNCQVGFTYQLMIRNTNAGTTTLTADGGATVTLAGTMTIAQNTTRHFTVTFPTAATCTIQSMGISAAAA